MSWKYKKKYTKLTANSIHPNLLFTTKKKNQMKAHKSYSR